MQCPFGQEACFIAKECRKELMPMELTGITLYHVMSNIHSQWEQYCLQKRQELVLRGKNP